MSLKAEPNKNPLTYAERLIHEMFLPQRRKDAKFGIVVISTLGRNPSYIPRVPLGMTGIGPSSLRLSAFAGDIPS
jgi:hypothetical protein